MSNLPLQPMSTEYELSISRLQEARPAYERALQLTRQELEQRLIRGRLDESEW